MTDYDVVMIGAGHNALVCAGYLAKAGQRVCVIERRARVGGAVVTEEIVPGYKFDLGGSAHILIHHTPVVRDLRLTDYGLEYIPLDPLFFAPFPDGSHLTIWQDLERTCDSIAAISRADAEKYRRFVTEWGPVAAGMVGAFTNPPTPWNLFRHLTWPSARSKQRVQRVVTALRSYGHFLRTNFETPQLQGLIGWMAAQSGPPPTEAFSAPFALWHPMYHDSGVKRPKGGSGMLTQALARMIEAHGGTILTERAVEEVLVENGRAVGVRLPGDEKVTGRRVVAGCHVHTLRRMLPAGALPRQKDALLGDSRIGNGFGMIVRCAVDELPNYAAAPSNGSPGPEHRALQFICPSLDYLDRAYADFLAGRPSAEPGLIAMTFSAVDETLAPSGKHTLFVWGQYYPYELASGENWDAIGDREADRMLAKLAEYAPNVPGSVTGRLVETPLYLERELGLLRGNVMHLEMSLDQMFLMRPALTMSDYRLPIRNLYLTGASTHPGGGIMGASGRNAAKVVLRDLRKPWRR